MRFYASQIGHSPFPSLSLSKLTGWLMTWWRHQKFRPNKCLQTFFIGISINTKEFLEAWKYTSSREELFRAAVSIELKTYIQRRFTQRNVKCSRLLQAACTLHRHATSTTTFVVVQPRLLNCCNIYVCSQLVQHKFTDNISAVLFNCA